MDVLGTVPHVTLHGTNTLQLRHSPWGKHIVHPDLVDYHIKYHIVHLDLVDYLALVLVHWEDL